jgi:hypothetical protein
MHKQKTYFSPHQVTLVYQNPDGDRCEQPLLDILYDGMLIDENGNDMPIVEVYVTV